MPVSKKTQSDREIHLFIIWEHARKKEEEIVDDISKKFNIIKTFEIHWTKSNFPENLSRFYGTQLPPNSRKELHVGVNPFLAIVVEDVKPKYRTHTTSKGDFYVNTSMFTSKALHREWTGGGHKIHASNDRQEADHNLTLLFGKNCKDFLEQYRDDKNPTKIEKWNHDLVGADGWKNMDQLFYTLNNTIKYVVLRNFEPLPDNYYAKDHGDIDLLVSSYRDAHFITRSKPVFKSRHRVYNKVEIAGDEVLFDFRYTADDYYDEQWEHDILDHRILSYKGFYVPNPENYMYSLLYHALIHKPSVSSDYKKRLSKLSKTIKLSIVEKSFDNGDTLRLLTDFMSKKSYSFTQPNDKSVFINVDLIASSEDSSVKFKRRKIIPFRNYLKKTKFPLKHYLLKIRKILRRRLRGVNTES